MNPSWVSNDAVESGLQSADGNGIAEQQLAPGKSSTFNLSPLFGLCNAGKYLPLRLSGRFSIELTLCDPEAAVVAGSSTSYELQEMSIRCAVVKLDSALESSYASMLLNNRALTLRCVTHSCQQMILPANSTEMSISLVRAYSRLNGLFITFQGGSDASTPAANKHQCTSFLCPSAFSVGGVVGGVVTHDESLLSWDVQIGSMKWPESPATSIPETFSLLRQATAIYDQSLQTLNITPQEFANMKYIIGVGLQTTPSAAFSGLNTRAGDLMTIRAKILAVDASVNAPGRCYVTLLHETICEIREGSVSVLD